MRTRRSVQVVSNERLGRIIDADHVATSIRSSGRKKALASLSSQVWLFNLALSRVDVRQI